MRTIERDIVSAVIISKDGKLLQVLQDPLGRGVYPGCWGLIGGGVEEGESQLQALQREVLEESGIDISDYDTELVHEAEGEAEKTLKETGERVLCKMKFYTYLVKIADKEASDIAVVLDEEHTEYAWTRPEDLHRLKLTPPSVGLFKELGYL